MTGRSPRWYRLFPLLAMVLASCGSALDPSIPVGICWADFIKFDGVRYMGPLLTAGRDLDDADLGELHGTVEFMLYDNVDDPDYQAEDGDAAFLEPGTPVHRVEGYSPEFRLAAKADGRIYLYEADLNPLAARGADLLDLAGAVDSLSIFAVEAPLHPVGAITDSATVEELVGMVLEAGLAENPSTDGKRYFIAFHLRDGTSTVRTYWPSTGFLGHWIVLPAAFAAAVQDAIDGGTVDKTRTLRAIGRVCSP